LPAPPLLKTYSPSRPSSWRRSREGRSEERRAIARGRDIYAVTAPIVVEAAERIIDGRFKATGVVAAGEAFDAQDFLRSLRPDVSLD
jgi:hypothetical protein